MKTFFSGLPIVIAAAMVTGLLYFSSCKKDQVNFQKEDYGKQTINAYTARCGIKICFLTAIRGNRRYSLDCVGNGICYVQRIKCYPDLVPCIPWKFPNCSVVDCNNPWNYKDIFVNPIPRFKNYFKGDPDPEPNLGFVPLKVTPNIAVLQFYTESKGTLDRQSLTLPASFNLPKDISENLGLKGFTVPAGKYPVVYDDRSKTLNAIVYVK